MCGRDTSRSRSPYDITDWVDPQSKPPEEDEPWPAPQTFDSALAKPFETYEATFLPDQPLGYPTTTGTGGGWEARHPGARGEGHVSAERHDSLGRRVGRRPR